MATASDPVDVRDLLLQSSDFGADEVDRLQGAIGSGQIADVRQYLRELESRAAAGEASEKNLLALGVGLYLLGQHEAAERRLAEISGNGPADFYRGQALMGVERFEEAAAVFEQAAANGFDRIDALLQQVGAVRRAGRLDEAEKLLSDISREAATRADYCYQKGCILADRGDTFGAIEYFERAVDMDGQHTGALFRLADLNNLLGNDAEAINFYERSLSRPPVHVGALLNLGLLYEDAENYRAAAFCFQRILAVFPNHQRAQLYLKDIEATGEMFYNEDELRRQREFSQIFDTPIGDFELSARSRNCLEHAGIRTIGDLTRISEQELLANKNFGETSLSEVRELLESRGLWIGKELTEPQTAGAALPADELSPQERALMESPVTDLNLSVRARKCLGRLGISTLGELVSRTPDELMSMRNFGVTSLNEIRAKLNEAGLKLRND